ncbi:hypothetical protein E2I00_014480 [Balaenoptera physalus]|uniref:Uncharacterized protein n=1 Tax=Balaenoptera physalus TaxID=9770 RepID=A0A643C2G4_BALPH|nr:hypothetical protein E2I00_014480 [Balaenoptera physalus]
MKGTADRDGEPVLAMLDKHTGDFYALPKVLGVILKSLLADNNEKQVWVNCKTDCLGSPVFTPIKLDISGNITAALYAAPYKSDLLKALSKGQNVTEEECLEKTRLFLVNYTATIDVIYEMYTKMNAELNYKVDSFSNLRNYLPCVFFQGEEDEPKNMPCCLNCPSWR